MRSCDWHIIYWGIVCKFLVVFLFLLLLFWSFVCRKLCILFCQTPSCRILFFYIFFRFCWVCYLFINVDIIMMHQTGKHSKQTALKHTHKIWTQLGGVYPYMYCNCCCCFHGICSFLFYSVCFFVQTKHDIIISSYSGW